MKKNKCPICEKQFNSKFCLSCAIQFVKQKYEKLMNQYDQTIEFLQAENDFLLEKNKDLANLVTFLLGKKEIN